LKIKVLKRTPRELKIEVEGEGHTLFNLLEKVLLEDDDVEMAGYNIPHPLTSNLILYVRSKGSKNPVEAINNALIKIIESGRALRKAFEDALQSQLEGGCS